MAWIGKTRAARRTALLLVALAAAAALASCGGGSTEAGTETATGSTATGTETGTGTTGEKPAAAGKSKATIIEVRNGEPVGGVQTLEYSAGEQIQFTVDSDVADEVHVHGYDVMKDVPAGGSASFSFPAELEGIFEVELEERAIQIAELRVNP